MFDAKTSIRMVRFVPCWDYYEDPGLNHHFDECSTQVAKGLYWTNVTYIVTQIHIVLVVAMSYHLVDPLCISRGYDQFMSLEYRSTMYFRWLYPLLSIRLWIRSVFYGGHILQVLITQAQVCLPWDLKYVMIFVGCLCASSVRFSESIPLLERLQIISVISSYLLTSYFGGQSVTHQNYSL